MPSLPAEQTSPHPVQQCSQTMRDLVHDEAEAASVGRRGSAGQAPKVKQQKQPVPPLQQRQGDRAPDGDAAAVRLPVFVRYKDLVAAGIVSSWMQLRRLIENDNFPRGVLLGRNTRAWRVQDITTWLDGRPSTTKAVNAEKTVETQRLKQVTAATAVQLGRAPDAGAV
jgi:predicted DNA-binding transcriptional regulator AlpA